MDMSNKADTEHFLVQIDRLIDWPALTPLVHAISTRSHADVPLAALKMLLISRWYGMGDAALFEACQDRISFRRFLGLPVSDTGDDARVAQAFRRNAKQAAVEAQNLVHAIEAQLLSKGFSIKAGMWADAAVVPMSADALLQNDGVSETSFFTPGEMAKVLRQSDGIVARGGEMIAERPPQFADTGLPQPLAEQETAPVRGVIEWPWGAKTDLTERLGIGREFGFCPYAQQMQPYRHVSRRHAEMLVCDAGVWVRDLYSHNHTYVDDEKIPPGQAHLVDADARVRLGPNFVILLKLEY